MSDAAPTGFSIDPWSILGKIVEMYNNDQAKAALKLATTHSVKGREFDAVAMMKLHEGIISFFTAETEPKFGH